MSKVISQNIKKRYTYFIECGHLLDVIELNNDKTLVIDCDEIGLYNTDDLDLNDMTNARQLDAIRL